MFSCLAVILQVIQNKSVYSIFLNCNRGFSDVFGAGLESSLVILPWKIDGFLNLTIAQNCQEKMSVYLHP